MSQSQDNNHDPNASAAASSGTGDATPFDPDKTRILPALGDSLPDSAAPAFDAQRLSTVGYRQVGRYQIQERLGKGAMATVYKAYDPSIDRTLAIKFLHEDLCVDEEQRGRFVREAKAAGGLAHANIVTIYDVGEIDGRPYIAMELLDGVTLSELIKPDVGLPAREVAIIALQLARALDYAHSNGIYHRDIKPSNIMQLKGGDTVKVTDFGIAHIGEGDHQQTQAGTILGTPHYMSPEQAMGLKVDGRSDLFSVGVLMYQLITGRLPFEAANLVSLAHKIVKEEATSITKLRRDTPPALRRIVERCLNKAPDKRFQNGKELTAALGKVIHDLAEETSNAGRPRVIPLRLKWALTMGLVVVVTMALTATIVIQRQYAAMMGQVIDYGASLANFLATENAEPTLLKEWVAIDVAVSDLMERQSFHEITVVDRDGTVQVSNKDELVGKPFVPASGKIELARLEHGVVVSEYLAENGDTIIDFDAPITFGQSAKRAQIGRVHLGIQERPLSKVARTSTMSMVFLVLVTLVAVVIATYFMADRYFKQIRLLVESMAEIKKGRYDYRIAEPRKDEFGQLYQAFDEMAETLQKRAEPEQTNRASET